MLLDAFGVYWSYRVHALQYVVCFWTQEDRLNHLNPKQAETGTQKKETHDHTNNCRKTNKSTAHQNQPNQIKPTKPTKQKVSKTAEKEASVALRVLVHFSITLSISTCRVAVSWSCELVGWISTLRNTRSLASNATPHDWFLQNTFKSAVFYLDLLKKPKKNKNNPQKALK